MVARAAAVTTYIRRQPGRDDLASAVACGSTAALAEALDVVALLGFLGPVLDPLLGDPHAVDLLNAQIVIRNASRDEPRRR